MAEINDATMAKAIEMARIWYDRTEINLNPHQMARMMDINLSGQVTSQMDHIFHALLTSIDDARAEVATMQAVASQMTPTVDQMAVVKQKIDEWRVIFNDVKGSKDPDYVPIDLHTFMTDYNLLECTSWHDNLEQSFQMELDLLFM
jgi:hypothetical protein